MGWYSCWETIKPTEFTLGPWRALIKYRECEEEWATAVNPHVAERTHEIYEVALRCHLKPALGALLLCDIDASRIASYQAGRKSEGASARTLNKELQVLRQVLKRRKLWANLQGDVKFERESDHIGKAMTEEQETELLAVCESNPLLRTVVILALNTARRKNEIRTLRWQQIDLIARTLTVGCTKTEGGSGRAIPLNSVAYAAAVRWASRFPEDVVAVARPRERVPRPLRGQSTKSYRSFGRF